MACISTKFSQRFLFRSLKNTRCYAEIWSKAAYKNEILKKFCDCRGLNLAVLTNYNHVKNYTLQKIQLKHYYPERLDIHTETPTSNRSLF